MKTILTAAVIGAFAFAAASPALALDAANQPIQRIIEQQPAASNEVTGTINRVQLVPGKNSFTENQAKQRIEKSGFTSVSALTMDAQGIWRGTASKGAMTMKVGLDFKGNVAADHAKAQ
jgi:putative membrane protein